MDALQVGKTRTIAGIIYELTYSGKANRTVWVSVNDTIQATIREELNIVTEGNGDQVVSVKNIKESSPKSLIVFCSYRMLVNKKYYERLTDWMGDDYSGLVSTFGILH